METEGSLPHSQVPATCLYPDPAQSSPWPQKICVNIILPSTSGSPQWSFSLKFPYKPLHSHIRATYPAYLIRLDYITRTIVGEQ
jgi:hypothetical protein